MLCRQEHTGFWWGNLREREHFEDQGVVGSIILKWIYRKWDGAAWNGLNWLRQVAGSCECGNESSGFHEMQGIS